MLVGVNRRVIMGSAAAYELFMFIDVTQTPDKRLNMGTAVPTIEEPKEPYFK